MHPATLGHEKHTGLKWNDDDDLCHIELKITEVIFKLY